MKEAVKSNKGKQGRLSGGQIVGIKKKLCANWNVVEWEYGMIIGL